MLKCRRSDVRLVSGLVIGMTMAAPQVRAELLDFSYVSSSSGDASWTMPSSPTPNTSSGTGDSISVTKGVESNGGSSDTYSSVNFYDVDFQSNTYYGFRTSGVLGMEQGHSGLTKFFSGTFDAPTFLIGSYDFTQGTLTISSASAVPEPASWVAMLLGFGALGALLRAARRGGIRAAV